MNKNGAKIAAAAPREFLPAFDGTSISTPSHGTSQIILYFQYRYNDNGKSKTEQKETNVLISNSLLNKLKQTKTHNMAIISFINVSIKKFKSLETASELNTSGNPNNE